MKTTRQMKPWIKATLGGTLRIDTSHPEWQKWFIAEIERLRTTNGYKLIKKQIANSKRQDGTTI